MQTICSRSKSPFSRTSSCRPIVIITVFPFGHVCVCNCSRHRYVPREYGQNFGLYRTLRRFEFNKRVYFLRSIVSRIYSNNAKTIRIVSAKTILDFTRYRIRFTATRSFTQKNDLKRLNQYYSIAMNLIDLTMYGQEKQRDARNK